jgi:hypothetical protein
MQTLQIRTTGRYNLEYSHLDDWREIGTVSEVTRSPRVFGDDELGDSCTQYVIVKVERGPGVNDDEVRRALKDTFSYSNCSHEHDCCGCWSHVATHATNLDAYEGDDQFWCVETHSYKNV